MKTLNEYIKESILDDEDVLMSTTKKSSEEWIIRTWCEKYNIFDGNFRVNNDLKIERTNKNSKLCLSFKDYNELPNYIQFEDDKDLIVNVGTESKDKYDYSMGKIESFKGLPKRLKALTISTISDYLPDLELECDHIIFNISRVTRYGKINLKVNDIVRFWDTPYDLTEIPNKIKIKGAKVLKITNCADFGDNFSKILNRKAPMNNYKNKFEFPVTDAGMENVKKFLGKSININDLESIEYTQNSKLVKYNNKWYRAKNYY